ncbi:MAG: extracellular solute-binding protein [Blautia sp.]|jgi:multiple sugar transport system substrate-binding protein
MKKWVGCLSVMLAAGLVFGGCSKSASGKLDPDNPVSITVWHYYNGNQQEAFDQLVDEFNSTVGKEKGVYVTGYSQGSVDQLEENVMASVKEEVGSDEKPNIFSSYADTAYAIEQMGELADIGKYVSEEELDEYVDSYIEEGRIGKNGELRIFPTAKSTEIFMMNKDAWEAFAAENDVSVEDLSTKEGLAKVAELYYQWTDAKTPDVPGDGKAFYGRDSMANLFIVGCMQLGTEIFQVKDGNVTIHAEKDDMKKIWDNYYVPYVKGYYSSYGRFRSDDVKTGEIVAFTGSSTSSMYFPDEVEIDGQTESIGYMVLPVPEFEGKEKYAVQQGAGMAVMKGTEEEEQGAVEFLKWFTKEENNITFGCESGYIPVKKSAYDKKVLDQMIKEKGLQVADKTYDSLLVGYDTVDTHTLYTNKAFEGGASARKVLEYNMADQMVENRQAVKAAMDAGASLDEAVQDYISEDAFEQWYQGFTQALEDSIKNS